MVSMICKIFFLLGQYAGSSSVFLQIKSLAEIERRVATQIDSSITSSEVLFHGLHSKSKGPSVRKQIASLLSSQLIVSFFLMKHSSAERYLANMFLPVFLWTFTKFLQRIRKMFRKFLESSQKTLLAKCFFSKVVGFYRSSHWRCPQKKCF